MLTSGCCSPHLPAADALSHPPTSSNCTKPLTHPSSKTRSTQLPPAASRRIPDKTHQLFGPLRLLLVAYCTSRGATEAGALSYFQELQREAFKHADELLEKDKIEVAATRIWTSAQTLDCIPGRGGIEFCSLLNEVLRLDDAVSAGACFC